jgi:hypothetical protein
MISQVLPVQRSPITAFTVRADVGRFLRLFIDCFQGGEEFRLTFFALIEVHHAVQEYFAVT